MPVQILICDHQNVSRMQLTRALPPEWKVTVSYASSGEEALVAVRRGKADVVLLVSTLPGAPDMNAFALIDALRREALAPLVFMIATDLPLPARRWAEQMGVKDFLSAPVNREQLRALLSSFGLPGKGGLRELPREVGSDESTLSHDLQTTLEIALSEAGGRLVEALQSSITLPPPQLHLCHYEHLPDHLACASEQRLNGVSLGFSGPGIAGEALLLVASDDLLSIHQHSLHYRPDSQTPLGDPLATQIELCALLAGSCLSGIGKQLALDFNQSYPVVLGREISLRTLLGQQANGREVLAVELSYRLVDETPCHLLLLITEDSIPVLAQRARTQQDEAHV